MPKVIILCGGSGNRLKPLSSNTPKPLVAIDGKPILQHIIEFYISKGFRDFVLCAGFRAEAVNDFIRSHNFDAEIEISNAGEDAGILERLYLCRHLITERAIVTYGDTFINIDPGHILKEHIKNKANVTITIADIRSPFGLVELDKAKRVTFFREKPFLSYYIGHMIMEKRVLDSLDADLISLPDGEGLISLFQKLIEEKSLNAYKYTGFKVTFNTPYEHKKAEEEFIRFFTEQGEG